MNAVLVFDPANDLIFVKSNVTFRSTILKYAQQNGLLANTSAGRSQVYKRRQFERHFSDSSANYTDTLMLMLTPYVASLRLSAELARSQEEQQQQQQEQHFCNNASANREQNGANKMDESGDLLTKFMSSININHECQTNKPDCYATTASLNNHQQQHQQHNQHLDANNCGGTCKESHYVERSQAPPRRRLNESKQHQNVSAAAAAAMTTSISTLKMPVECLQDCQVVYCALYDFIFIHMQQLTTVSSFKMRLIQKRIDLFARLTLLLFGQALQSLKITRSSSAASNITQHIPPTCNQTLVLRHAYERWFELQFEAELFLEVNERLIVGSDILHLCQETLRNISAELRKREQQLVGQQQVTSSCWRQLETHQHALLYSNCKLVSKFSCLNSQPILNDDLILLLLLVKIFNRDHSNEYEPLHENDSASVRLSKESSCTSIQAQHTYKSHYDIDPHTHQILLANKTIVQTKRPRRRQKCTKSQQDEPVAKSAFKLPHQLAIFLAAQDHHRTSTTFVQPTMNRTYVPHMLRFVVLTPGITLLLVSELSTLAQLNLHLTRAHKLLLGFSAGGNHLTAAVNPLMKSTHETTRTTSNQTTGELERTTEHLRLSQLARVNDCLSAIRAHFNANFRQLFAQKVSSTFQRDKDFTYADDDDHDDHDSLNDGHQIVSVAEPSAMSSSSSIHDEQQAAHESASANCPARRNSSLISSLFRKYFIASEETEQQQRRRQSKRNNSDGQTDYDHEDGDIFCDYDDHDAAAAAQVSDVSSAAAAAARKEIIGQGHQPARTIFECLNLERQRLCRHLVRRLQELAQNNVHTYVKQTFSLPLDQHKRDALLTSVCATLRDSFSQLILAPQLEYLATGSGGENQSAQDQLRRFSAAQVDCARLLARRQLSDYLDYLAVKATGACNVTLGAPLTHDMPAICGFLYVDRARQVLIKSPLEMSSSMTQLNERELCEADFESAIERYRRAQKRHSSNSDDDDDDFDSSSTSASYNSSDNSYDEDESSSGEDSPTGSDKEHSSGDSIESIIYKGPPLPPPPRSYAQNQFLGTSQDVVLYENNNAAAAAATPTRAHQMARLASSLANLSASNNQSLDAHSAELLISGDHLISQPKVDANLVKGFAAFVYNRLANGQVNSFAQNNSAHDQHLAYFMWFKRQQDDKLVAPQQSRRLEVSHRLSAHFKSLPNVTCDDFFTNLTKSLILLDSHAKAEQLTCDPSESSTSSTMSLNSQINSSTKRRVKVYCQLRELDPNTGRHLLRRQLTRVREEEDDNDDDEQVADEQLDIEPATSRLELSNFEPRLMRSKSSHHLREQQDFNSFMRQQKSGPTLRRNHQSLTSGNGGDDEHHKDDDNRIGCCELFCFHNTNLIVHKSQPAIEAQRLAQRLASLLASMQE